MIQNIMDNMSLFMVVAVLCTFGGAMVGLVMERMEEARVREEREERGEERGRMDEVIGILVFLLVFGVWVVTILMAATDEGREEMDKRERERRERERG